MITTKLQKKSDKTMKLQVLCNFHVNSSMWSSKVPSQQNWGLIYKISYDYRMIMS